MDQDHTVRRRRQSYRAITRHKGNSRTDMYFNGCISIGKTMMRTHSMPLLVPSVFRLMKSFSSIKLRRTWPLTLSNSILLPQTNRKLLQPLRAAYGVLSYLFNSEQQVYSTLNAHFPQEKCRLCVRNHGFVCLDPST